MRQILLRPSEIKLLSAMRQHQVRYLIVGGRAIVFHGHTRFSKDLDLFYDNSNENCACIIAALHEVGVVIPDLGGQSLSSPWKRIKLGGGFNTDLLSRIHGVSFDEACPACEKASCGKLEVPVISLPHLLKNLQANPRPKNLKDIEVLGKILEGDSVN